MKSKYVKRTQKDYPMSFKLSVVLEVEKGKLTYKQAQIKYGIQCRSTVLEWLRKYGNFDWENQKARAEHKAERADKKAILFDMMIDLAEKEFNIPIRKNSKPK